VQGIGLFIGMRSNGALVIPYRLKAASSVSRDLAGVAMELEARSFIMISHALPQLIACNPCYTQIFVNAKCPALFHW